MSAFSKFFSRKRVSETMSRDEQAIENEIQAKGLNAPRLTPEHIDSVIVGEDYHVFPGTTKTVCCLMLRNGFTVIGEAACASPENFDEEIGRRVSGENARRKIWDLEGYLLREGLWHIERDKEREQHREASQPIGGAGVRAGVGEVLTQEIGAAQVKGAPSQALDAPQQPNQRVCLTVTNMGGQPEGVPVEWAINKQPDDQVRTVIKPGKSEAVSFLFGKNSFLDIGSLRITVAK